MSSRATEFERVIRSGGVALFPSDTVYGLACDPEDPQAVKRLYAIKRRPAGKPAARMFFDLAAALDALPAQASGPRLQAVITALLPGPATLVLPGGQGLRVVDVPQLRGVTVSVLQSSANLSGEPDARTLDQVNRAVRAAVDLRIDGGELPGTPSSVVDLRNYELDGSWRLLRAGALPEAVIAAVLDA